MFRTPSSYKLVYLIAGLFIFHFSNAQEEPAPTAPVAILLDCNKPPVISCPPDFFGCPGDSVHPRRTGIARAMRGEPDCPDPVVTWRDDTISSGNCTGSYVIERIWIASDTQNQDFKDSCIQIITLKDERPPFIFACPPDTTILSDDDCQAVYKWVEPRAIDNCDSVMVLSSHTPGDSFPIGTTTVTYLATDICGNETICSFDVTVLKNCCVEPPRINCPPDYFGCPGEDISPLNTGEPVTAPGSPTCDTPLVRNLDRILSQGPCQGAIVIERLWIVTDPSDTSLTSSCLQIITLEDTIGPEIDSCPMDITVIPNAGCDAVVNWTPPTARDNCGVVFDTASHNPGDTFSIGNTIVSYEYTDLCGNISYCSFMITVLDSCCNRPPEISCPADYTACPLSDTDPGSTGQPTVKKGHPDCGEPIVAFKDDTLSTGPCTGQISIQRMWTATDPDQPALSDTCFQMIDLEDIEAPLIVDCPADITHAVNDKCYRRVNWFPPLANDNCSSVKLTSTHEPGDTFSVGTTTVMYFAEDSCGNRDTCAFDITIEGKIFELTCPNDTLITNPNQRDGEYVYWETPELFDCSEACPDSIDSFIFMGERNGHKYFCSLYSATWPDAQRHCTQIGGHLGVMNDKEENSFVASKLIARTGYIGLTDKEEEGQFEWVNGDPVTFTNWEAGQPDNLNGLQDYVEMAPSGLWNDEYADIRNEFICELPCHEIEQIEGPGNGDFFECGITTVTYVAQNNLGFTDTCSFDVTVDCSGFSNYCRVLGFSSNENWIEKFELANINNRTGDDGGYGNYVNQCAEILSPSTEEVCIDIGYDGAPRNIFWKIWIDYNKDGDFLDKGEEIVAEFGQRRICTDIDFPDNINVRTQMRVGIAYNEWPRSCRTVGSGEYEDYCIIIEDGTARLRASEDRNADRDMPQQVQIKGELTILPNPAWDEITILASSDTPEELILVNIYGQTVKEVEWPQNSTNKLKLNIRDLASGQYLVRSKYADGKVDITSFIVAK
ncbi:MAG: HYR domain-containing protein [Saprospiraceae bacterium]|nr:HYR domain-containing protein [Saprospiraceae bacterium]